MLGTDLSPVNCFLYLPFPLARPTIPGGPSDGIHYYAPVLIALQKFLLCFRDRLAARFGCLRVAMFGSGQGEHSPPIGRQSQHEFIHPEGETASQSREYREILFDLALKLAFCPLVIIDRKLLFKFLHHTRASEEVRFGLRFRTVSQTDCQRLGPFNRFFAEENYTNQWVHGFYHC